MKLNAIFVFLLVTLFAIKAGAQNCSAIGTISVGPAGDYPSLTAAASALRLIGPAGNLVIELQADYSSAGETFPISFAGIGCVSASSTITIRPQANATALSIATDSQYTVDLANTQYLIIDGRPGGTGTTNALSIVNTHNKGAAVRFINSASHNTLQYLDVRGSASTMLPAAVTTYDTTAVINFMASTTGAGCDSNVIDHCNVFEADPTGNVYPATGIHALGVSTRINNHNSISNCNIYNFYQQSANSSGINIEEYNSDWSITGNSIYQTLPAGYVLSTYTPAVYFIKIKSTLFNDFVIEGNYLGGSAPAATGAQLELGGNLVLYGISVANAYIPGHPSVVRNNVIRNLAVSVSNNLGWFDAITLSNFFGHCTGNLIGDTTTPESIRFYGTGNSPQFIGISSTINNYVQPDTIKGNIISGISYQGSNGSFIGINTGGSGNMVVDSNWIGYPGMSNSILNNGGGSLYGIRIVNYSSSGKLFLRGNTCANFTGASGVYSSGSVAGIYAEGSASGRYVIEGNRIFNLKSANITLSATTASVAGLLLNIGGTPAMRISNNKIYNLSTTNSPSSSFGTYVHGIYYNGPAAGADSIHSNIISGLTCSSLLLTGTQNMQGINLQAGNSMVYNNVIRLGLNEDGTSINEGFAFTGINEVAGLNRIVHNSVYIGGNNAGINSINSYAFKTAVSSGSRVVANNIFYNGRSSVTGNNYAIAQAGAAAPGTDLFLDNNIYFADGANGYLGNFNGSNYSNLSNWRTALQKDNSSVFLNPSFKAIANPLATMDYHLNNMTPAEGTGAASYSIPADIDGEDRAQLTPVDIGADAGLYTNSNAPVMPAIRSFIPAAASAGDSITITGSGFNGCTAVSFGNVPAASFSVISDSIVIAVVGDGSSGFVKVVNPAGTAQLAGFTFLPLCSWTGLIDNAWENAGNWSCGFVPNSNTVVKIDSGVVVLASNATVWSLSVAQGATLTVSAPYTLTILH